MLSISRRKNEMFIVECEGYKVYCRLNNLDFKNQRAIICFEGDKEMIIYREEIEHTSFPAKLRANVLRGTS